jgi:hypothetical protein
MFFSISTRPTENFSNTHSVGRLYLGLDEGWRETTMNGYRLFYKGYADSGRLEQVLGSLLENRSPRFTGNFCVIYQDLQTQTMGIINDLWRSFPIYIHEQQVTNLNKSGHQIWADTCLEVTQSFDLQTKRHDIIGVVDNDPVTWDQALDLVHDVLSSKIKSFLNYYDGTVKVFLSGGVDTLLVYSYLRRFTTRIEMVWNNHIDYDRFWMLNSGTIKEHWAYRQIHHWIQPSVLASGAPGDEFMLRNPYTAHMWTQWHGLDLARLLQGNYQDCYHNYYFARQNHMKLFASQVEPVTDCKQRVRQLCNNVVNDFQHWHLGHTLTWTPLRDLEIFKIMLRVPPEQALQQIMNSDFSRSLIERNCAGLTCLLSDKKNTGDPLANLVKFDQFG